MRIFDLGEPASGPRVASDRVLTVPNAISLMRILALPLIWWDLVGGRLGRALILVIVFSATDWIDGYLARRLDQVSRLGQLLDPLADRALFAVVAVGAAVTGLLPWWVVVTIVARDVMVVAAAAVILSRDSSPPPVSRLGKAATFGLMSSFPLLIGAGAIGDGASAPAPMLYGLALSMLAASVVAYWLTALAYGWQLMRKHRGPTHHR